MRGEKRVDQGFAAQVAHGANTWKMKASLSEDARVALGEFAGSSRLWASLPFEQILM